MKWILVTGGCGFIGSNYIRQSLRERSECGIVNLDALTYAGNPENLKDIEEHPCYRFVKGDICDRKTVADLFSEYAFEAVINFAAESHVDRSIAQPELFFRTNVLGTQVLLDAARRAWKKNPGNPRDREYRPGIKFLQISTDEVYGPLPSTGSGFREEDPLRPRSPYAASKAGADLAVLASFETYGMPVCITRCSNNYGPYQCPEKLIPRMIYCSLHDMPLPIYGDGLQIRSWLHVRDHCRAIRLVLENGRAGEIYHIGGDAEATNLETVRLILSAVGKNDAQIVSAPDRPAHDRRYAIDHAKLTAELGFAPSCSFEEGLRETVEWYVSHRDWLDRAYERQEKGRN